MSENYKINGSKKEKKEIEQGF